MHMYTLSKENLEHNGDVAKGLVLYALYQDGLLTLEQVVQWSKTHTVVLRKPSRISEWYRKMVGKEGAEDFSRMMIATIDEIEFKEAAEEN